MRVGEIDNAPSFKSTSWLSKVMDKDTGENLRFNKAGKAELMKHGRGAKVNNINAKDFKIFDDDTKYMIYHNPNKQQALQELYMRELDLKNWIKELQNRINNNQVLGGLDLDSMKKLLSYNKRKLSQIQNDIYTIQSGRYSLDMMKKYRGESVDNNSMDYKKESSKPWELDIFGTKVYNEAAAILSEGILDIFKNRKNETPKTSEQCNEKYINVSSSDFDTIEMRLKSLESKFRNKIEPICNKYPAYAMRTTGIDDWLKWYGARWLHEVFGGCVKIIDGKIDTPQAEFGVIGADTYTFFNMLKNDDPNEYQRIASMYDLESRFEMVDVQWGEKLCGYDKTLNEITDDITSIIKNEFPMIIDYDYTGDNDSGPVYSGRISHQYIYDGIVPSDILTLNEAVGDADDMKPESDHPVRETLQDIDRNLLKVQQGAKKKVQSVMNVGRTFMKPAKRTHQWVTKLVNDWKDNDENKIKEKLADPTARKNIFNAIAWSIKTGSFLKAGLLLNPIFLFLTITKNVGKNKKEFRLRNEMIGELKTELKVIDEKIKDADYNHDNQAKYKLMRLKNEIEKKLARVGGSYTRSWRKLV